MAKLLDVSLDWLEGHTDLELEGKMTPEDKNHVFALLDAFIKQTKMQSVLQ